jgi:hypothetical protein
MRTNIEKPRRRRGRPSKAEELQRALAEIGVDPALIDPRRVLAAICINKAMPPTARVAAAKALLGLKDQDTAEDEVVGSNDVAARAVRLMAAARKAH